MSFYVGQKVVCIDNSPGMLGHPTNLVRGTIYTVSALEHCPIWGEGIKVWEVECNTHGGIYQPWWFAHRFRPVVECKTDISFALDILDRANREVKEPTGA